jgi:histidine triad (HIT) family protein
MAVAIKKTYQCGGITTRESNEPVGDQHAFHYHHHIFFYAIKVISLTNG